MCGVDLARGSTKCSCSGAAVGLHAEGSSLARGSLRRWAVGSCSCSGAAARSPRHQVSAVKAARGAASPAWPSGLWPKAVPRACASASSHQSRACSESAACPHAISATSAGGSDRAPADQTQPRRARSRHRARSSAHKSPARSHANRPMTPTPATTGSSRRPRPGWVLSRARGHASTRRRTRPRRRRR